MLPDAHLRRSLYLSRHYVAGSRSALKLRRRAGMVTNRILSHRISGRYPEPSGTGAGSFKRMLGPQTSRSRPSGQLSSAGASARSSLLAAGVGAEARFALRPDAPARRPRNRGCPRGDPCGREAAADQAGAELRVGGSGCGHATKRCRSRGHRFRGP